MEPVCTHIFHIIYLPNVVKIIWACWRQITVILCCRIKILQRSRWSIIASVGRERCRLICCYYLVWSLWTSGMDFYEQASWSGKEGFFFFLFFFSWRSINRCYFFAVPLVLAKILFLWMLPFRIPYYEPERNPYTLLSFDLTKWIMVPTYPPFVSVLEVSIDRILVGKNLT